MQDLTDQEYERAYDYFRTLSPHEQRDMIAFGGVVRVHSDYLPDWKAPDVKFLPLTARDKTLAVSDLMVWATSRHQSFIKAYDVERERGDKATTVARNARNAMARAVNRLSDAGGECRAVARYLDDELAKMDV